MDWSTFKYVDVPVGTDNTVYFCSPDNLQWVGVITAMALREAKVFAIQYSSLPSSGEPNFQSYVEVTDEMRDHFIPLAQAVMLGR